jgi:hypothetical protein
MSHLFIRTTEYLPLINQTKKNTDSRKFEVAVFIFPDAQHVRTKPRRLLDKKAYAAQTNLSQTDQKGTDFTIQHTDQTWLNQMHLPSLKPEMGQGLG